MASVIYYKLKNALQQQTINFDGSVIQIGDVKRLVAQKEGLGQEGAAELTLFDPNTNVEYSNDSKVIPRNSHVLVKRAPATKFKPLLASTDETQPVSSLPTVEDANLTNMAAPSIPPIADFGGDFYSEQPTAPVVGEDETKALQNFLQGTATTWQREVRQAAARGRGRGRGRGAIPSDYKCPRCDALGAHWQQDCPTHGDPTFDKKKVRPPVGIPMTRLLRSQGGGLVLPDGNTGTLLANEDAFAREVLGLGVLGAAEQQAVKYAGAVGVPSLLAGEQKAVLAIEGGDAAAQQQPTVSMEPAAGAAGKVSQPDNAMGMPGPSLPRQQQLPLVPGATFKPPPPPLPPTAALPPAAAAAHAPLFPLVSGLPSMAMQAPALAGIDAASGPASTGMNVSSAGGPPPPSMPHHHSSAVATSMPPQTDQTTAMPGSNFFDVMLKKSILPRGPPAFLEKAYSKDGPLSKEDFYKLQSDYRKRYNLAPLHRGSSTTIGGDDKGDRGEDRRREGSSRHHRDGRQRDSKRDRSRERSRRRRRSRTRSKSRERKSKRSKESEENGTQSQRSSAKGRDNKESRDNKERGREKRKGEQGKESKGGSGGGDGGKKERLEGSSQHDDSVPIRAQSRDAAQDGDNTNTNTPHDGGGGGVDQGTEEKKDSPSFCVDDAPDLDYGMSSPEREEQKERKEKKESIVHDDKPKERGTGDKERKEKERREHHRSRRDHGGDRRRESSRRDGKERTTAKESKNKIDDHHRRGERSSIRDSGSRMKRK